MTRMNVHKLIDENTFKELAKSELPLSMFSIHIRDSINMQSTQN